MRHIQAVGTMLLLLATGLASSEAFGQKTLPRDADNPALSGEIEYDGGIGLLKVQQIQEELQLEPGQVERLLEIFRETSEQMRELYEGLANLPAGQRDQLELETIRELARTTLAKIKEVLRPQQLERLKQIKTQLRMRRGQGINPDIVANLLGLSDIERNRLRLRELEIAAELREKIAQLRQEARAELLKSLPADQRARLEDLLGEPFEFQWGQGGFGEQPAQP